MIRRPRHLVASAATVALAALVPATIASGGQSSSPSSRLPAPDMNGAVTGVQMPSSRAISSPVIERAAVDPAVRPRHLVQAASTITPRQRVVNQVNKRRTNNGLPKVSMAPRPAKAAKWQSNHQANVKTVTHVGPNGGNGGDRLTAAGYPWWMWGEAVAGGYEKPKQVVNAWMNSAGHRAILLDSRPRHIGVWSARDSNGRRYWTLVIANR